MARNNYKAMIKDNSTVNYTVVLPLTDIQERGLKKHCKKNFIPSGNDNKNHFLLRSGLYHYKLAFIKTSSGKFVKIKKLMFL